MLSHLLTAATFSGMVHHAAAAGFRTVGSSGCAAQMVFVPPYTDTAVFLDNYHANFGGPGVNLETGAHSPDPYNYDGTNTAVFATEYCLRTNTLRKLHPQTNTFCSAGSFFPDGTLVNFAGAEPDAAAGVGDGFNAIRTYPSGPCPAEGCTMDFTVGKSYLQAKRWYPTAETLPNGDILVVGGSNMGGLVMNEASINVPTYELIKQTDASPPPVTLPILEFTEAENNQPNKSYNLYPILHQLPNPRAASEVFTIAGNRAVIWDYSLDKLVKELPNTPLEPRCFPSSATSVLLPLRAPAFEPTVLLCGGSSADIPAPQALNDCYTIAPHAETPTWEASDALPNGPQTMTDGILLPDGTVLLINGAHRGSGGGFMADDPVLTPLIYDPRAALGSRFTRMPGSAIPRLYHSVATLLPSGEVLVAGSNPMVGYTATGEVARDWPAFGNNGHYPAFLQQQQRGGSRFPTEYRVEVFSPPYMDAERRPAFLKAPEELLYGRTFAVKADLEGGVVEIVLVHPGFHTHAVAMGQRMVVMESWMGKAAGQRVVRAPPGPSTAQPGVYLMFVVVDGIPSEGKWVKLSY